MTLYRTWTKRELVAVIGVLLFGGLMAAGSVYSSPCSEFYFVAGIVVGLVLIFLAFKEEHRIAFKEERR